MVAHQVIVLLLIGYLIYIVDSKREYFPVPVILVLIGIGLSFIPFFDSLHISKEIIFNVFLPALLFTSAYQFPFKQLKDNLGIIFTLSTLGLMLTALLLGFGIYLISGPFVELSITASFLLAAILIPTDPVSVTAILKKSSGEEQIADVVEAESMVNDGTSVVIFTIFLSMFETGDGFSFGTFLLEFLLVSLGGVAIGVAAGWIIKKTIYFSFRKHYQVMLTVVVAYGAFYIAEAIGVSGVLATVITGIYLAYELGSTNKSDQIKGSLDGFWDIVIPMFLSVLFLMIGIQAADYLAFSYWGLAAVIFILSIIARFIVLGGFIYSVPAWRKEFKHDLSTTSLLTWAGIKGTMSIALLLWLEAEVTEKANLIISLAFAVVLLSLVIQSLGIYPLTRFLNKEDKKKE